MNLESFITTFTGDKHAVNNSGASKQIALFYLFDALVVKGKNTQSLLSETPKDLLIEGLDFSYEPLSVLDEYQYGDIVIWDAVPEGVKSLTSDGFLGIITAEQGLSLRVFAVDNGIPQVLSVSKEGIARVYRPKYLSEGDAGERESVLIGAFVEMVALMRRYQKQTLELMEMSAKVPKEHLEFFVHESDHAARNTTNTLLQMEAEL